MKRTRQRLLALACALLVAATDASAKAATAAAAPARPAATGTTAAPAVGSPAAAKPRRAAAPAAPAAAPAPSSRRLEDVHIEGELEVPRVTFITVRQPHRFHDYTRATSVRSSRRMAAEATFPAWISPVPATSPDARKETRK